MDDSRYTLQATGEGWPGSNFPKRTLRTNHWSLSRAFPPPERPMPFAWQACPVKMPLLHTKLSKIKPASRKLAPVTYYRPVFPHGPLSRKAQLTVAEWTEAGKAEPLLPGKSALLEIRLPYQPLATQHRHRILASRVTSGETQNIPLRPMPVKRCPAKILRPPGRQARGANSFEIPRGKCGEFAAEQAGSQWPSGPFS